MDSANKVLAITLMCITVVVSVAIGTVGFNHWQTNKRISEAITNGFAPSEANCAYEDTMGNNPTCVLFANGRANKLPNSKN